MTKTLFLFFILGFAGFLLISCNEKVFTGSVDCAACYQEKPVSYYFYVYLTFNDSISEIPLILFRGKMEDGDTVCVDTAWAGKGNEYMYAVDADVDKEYSMLAVYRFPNKTIYAVNELKMKAKLITDVCDQSCWIIDNNSINLEIRQQYLE
jgi:hypothetical protein